MAGDFRRARPLPAVQARARLSRAPAALGLGNGAVFKLVPQFFPKETGTVTGLVGAFGGLGGFFPPLALGLIRDATGGYAWGFVFLACFALACLAVHYFHASASRTPRRAGNYS